MSKIVEMNGAFQRVNIRLYGGWFEGKNLTHAALRLSADAKVFPKKFTVSGTNGGAPVTLEVVAQVELAQSMQIDPRTALEGTYREHGLPTGLRCRAQPYMRCANPSNCRIMGVYDFIERGSSQEPRCSISTFDVLWRAEQKLVDLWWTDYSFARWARMAEFVDQDCELPTTFFERSGS